MNGQLGKIAPQTNGPDVQILRKHIFLSDSFLVVMEHLVQHDAKKKGTDKERTPA